MVTGMKTRKTNSKLPLSVKDEAAQMKNDQAAMSMHYGPQLLAARMYEASSKNGNQYFRGRLGALSVVLIRSNEISETGMPIWNLMLREAPPARAKGANECRKAARTAPCA